MRIALLCLLVACGSTQPAPKSSPLPSPFAELEPWVGDWEGDDGSTEHWVSAGGALYGVWFHGDQYTIRIVDDGEGGGRADGVLRFLTIHNGNSAIAEREVDRASFSHAGQYRRAPAVRAEELEAADLQFAADTSADGIVGWMKWFAPTAGMLRKGERIEGAAIREMMAPVLMDGVLVWAPLVGRRSPTNKLGFTVGTAKHITAAGTSDWASSYVTIWQQQTDGTWKVTFDTGRPIQQP